MITDEFRDVNSLTDKDAINFSPIPVGDTMNTTSPNTNVLDVIHTELNMDQHLKNIDTNFVGTPIEVGDIIIKINNEDVRKSTIKEDPAIKNIVHYDKLPEDENSPQLLLRDIDSPLPPPQHHQPPLEMVNRTNTNKVEPPKYEAFIMTGERIINISKNGQVSLLPKRDRKVDCLIKNGGPKKFHKVNSNSVPSSPVENDRPNIIKPNSGNTSPVSPPPTNMSNYKRGSRSEDPLRSTSEYPMSSTTSIDTEDEDITSSCNTLLNTNIKPLEMEDKRVLWTYNAGNIPDETSASCYSLQKVISTTSPTSISSSIMSSPSDRRQPAKGSYRGNSHPTSSHSNISSPDFQDTADSDFLINSRELEVTDPCDSDSTILLSEPKIRKRSTEDQYTYYDNNHTDHRIAIQVKSPEKTNLVRHTEYNNRYYNDKENTSNNENQDFKDEEEVQNLLALMEGAAQYYSPKAVDMPSAVRLAKRLFYLEGFKKSDVSRHLSKKNDFSRAVAEEYLKYFDFNGNSLDLALRHFLKQFSLTGETLERERALVHFSKRLLDCNPQCFNSQDLHGQMIGRKITCNEFIKNLAGLFDNEHFPRDVLKLLYMAIKSNPLEWASDDDSDENQLKNSIASQPIDSLGNKMPGQIGKSGGSYDENVMTQALEYKKGYVMRKCCLESNEKKSNSKRNALWPGFSLLSIADCPPVIYDIIENTPAAECAKIEVGDIIIKINNEDVRKSTIKEDPAIKNIVHYDKLPEDENSPQLLLRDIDSPLPPPQHHQPPLEMVNRTNTNKVEPPKYEAFIMTGERIINISKNGQVSLLPKRDRKVDCLIKNGGPKKFHKVNSNSVPSSPVENDRPNIIKPNSGNTSPVAPPPTNMSNYKRGSRSEDPLRFTSEYPMSSTTSIDTEDEDITSSCNTLLNTNIKPLEMEDKRVLWTYNAGNIPDETSASCYSLQKVISTTSPTSISSSIMSSPSDRRRPAKGSYRGNSHPTSSHSNISSPDFQETADSDFLINSRELEVTDPSDSDSTILSSEPKIRKRSTEDQYTYYDNNHTDHRIAIQVKGPEKTNLVRHTENNNRYYNDKENTSYNENQDFKDEEEVQHLLALMKGAAQLANSVTNNDEHWTQNEDFDSDSLHSFHYSPKAVDMPSAVRLVKRLFYLEGFKKRDVSRQLIKNNEFSRAVAGEYLKYFDFKGNSLDLALRHFLKQFSLTGKTQERERVLVHFSKRFLDCNPQCFNSQGNGISTTSPTSISSSIMSSPSDRRRPAKGSYRGNSHPTSSHSNISSPDFQDTADSDFLINSRELEVTDPSDSDSTILSSEPKIRKRPTEDQYTYYDNNHTDHRIAIQVKGPQKTNLVRHTEINNSYYNDKENTSNNENQDFKDEEEVQHLLALTEDAAQLANSVTNNDEHWTQNEDFDTDSLHSFHYSPKAVDIPSAVRLAKRLFYLEGFKKSDVSRHLSKNNEFSRAVAEEYLKYFDYKGNSLDLALRHFLKQFSLTGKTLERERVLVHFSKRFLDCNPQCFNSQDAVHTLTCAIMLLNTDLHGQMIGRKMTCNEFIENLAGLNDNDHFPRDVLKLLYMAIKSNPLEWASDDDLDKNQLKNSIASQPIESLGNKMPGQIGKSGGSYDENVMTQALEYKKGYVMRKCCMDSNGKKTARGKRSWKMYYCTLGDLILYLHKDDSGFQKSQISDSIHNAIHIHHGLATKATDYTKKQHVFRLVTADQAEYLFQTSDSKELDSWINTINFVCASFSAPRFPSAVGNQKKFHRPLLPSAPTKLNLREQLREHEDTLEQLEVELEIHKKKPQERGTKNTTLQFYKEKETHLLEEYKRYKTYVDLLRSKMIQHPKYDSSTALMETDDEAEVVSVDEQNSSLPTKPNVTKKKSIWVFWKKFPH